jgi:hypothetical protein
LTWTKINEGDIEYSSSLATGKYYLRLARRKLSCLEEIFRLGVFWSALIPFPLKVILSQLHNCLTDILMSEAAFPQTIVAGITISKVTAVMGMRYRPRKHYWPSGN